VIDYLSFKTCSSWAGSSSARASSTRKRKFPDHWISKEIRVKSKKSFGFLGHLISWAPDLFFISWAPWAWFEKSDFSQKISWAPGHGLRNPIFPKKFLGRLGHGFRNPIFPKNRISWAPWARFEKSDFSQKIGFLGHLGRFEKLGHLGHGFRNPIFPKKSDFLGAWALFEKSYFSQKIGFLGHLGRFEKLGHLGHGLRNPIFPKKSNRISWAPWAV
jgi:hypothetical protein